MINYLRAIDRTAYRNFMRSNVAFLDTLSAFIVDNFDPRFSFKNLLAKDDVDPVTVSSKDLGMKLKKNLVDLIEARRFYNITDSRLISKLCTEIALDNYDIDVMVAELVSLQDLHMHTTDIEVVTNRADVMAKFAYNRSRIYRALSGMPADEMDLLETGLSADDYALADDICRINGVQHGLTNVLRSVEGQHGNYVDMIRDLSRAMLQYRSSLVSPDAVGFGRQRTVTDFQIDDQIAAPGAQAVLRQALTKWADNPGMKPCDFMYSFQESLRLSGVDLLG